MRKVINKIGQSLRRVVLYLRLSKEDLDKLTPEERSESIKNQESMLRNYAEQQGWEIVGVYDDEDYSGSDRDRPNFNKMIKECEAGNVDIVLVKTQSRFARDMTLIDLYVHNKFKEWGVRFVTYIERIDNTRKETKKTSQITAMTDEWYLEDTSDNIRATLRDKKEQGLFTGSFAPYGYLRDPDDKNSLIIDPVASEIVKKIFELYNNGWGYYKIICYLNDERIPSPYDYKKMNGSKMGSPATKQRQNISSISKKGNYIIVNTLENMELEKITDIKSIGMLTLNNKLGEKIPTYIDLKVRKLDKNVRLFVSSILQENIDLKDLDFENNEKWEELQIGDIITNETLYIGVQVNEIKRLGTANYELEAFVNYNSKYPEYHYISEATCNGNKNVKSYARYEKKPGWSDTTIASILRNEYYIGNTVQGKFRNVSYKDQRSKHTSKDEWIIVENTHDPIIEKDLWYSVQNRLQSIVRTDTTTGEVNPLSKKVYCSCCGKSFEKTNGSGHKHEYMGCRDKRTRWLNCDNKSLIRYDILENQILTEINKFITNFKDGNILNNLNQEMIDKDMFKNKINALKKELQDNEHTISSKDKYFQQLYEDRVNQIINESQFFALSRTYNEDVKKLEERQESIKTELEMLYSKQAKLKDTDKLFSKYEKVEKLTVEISNEWIDKIYIGKLNTDNNSRDIQIVWNF